MRGLVQELHFAIRQVARRPGFSAIVVLTLALGIGATTAIAGVVYGVLLRPLPYPDPQRLVMICETEGNQPVQWCGGSPANWLDWSRLSQTLETVGLARSWQFSWARDGAMEGVSGGVATPGLFQVFEAEPLFGRLFEERDIQPGNEHVVIVSEEFWARRLDGSSDPVGTTMTIDGEAYQVIAVLPRGFEVPDLEGVEVWIPLWPEDVSSRSWRGFMPHGRLRQGVSLEQARAEMETIRDQLAREYPDTNAGWGVLVDSLHDRTVRPVRTALLAFMAAVVAVLLIACANVANLFLTRGVGRQREFAVRLALGASRARLVRHLVIESLPFAALGAGLGALLALWAVRLFPTLAPGWFPRLAEVRTDNGLLLTAVVLAALSMIASGVLPALHAGRLGLDSALRGGRDGAEQRRAIRVREVLAVSGVALACLLLITAGLLLRSFAGLLDWQPGFDRSNLMFVSLFSSQGTYPEVKQVVDLYGRVVEEVGGLPGVAAAAAGSAVPLYGGDGDQEYLVEGLPDPGAGKRPRVFWYDVYPGYFRTVGIPLVEGRLFGASDHRGAPPVAIINRTMARRHWPGASAIGQRLRMEAHGGPFEVVGVVEDVKPFRPDQSPRPAIYWPFAQMPRWAVMLVVRTELPGLQLEQVVRTRLEELDPDMEVGRFRTLDERVSAQLANPRFNMVMVGTFSALAALIALVGVYGIVSFSVEQRTREIGVRMALGADRRAVFRLAAFKGLGIGITGLALGMAGAAVATRLIESLLIVVRPTDPMTFFGIGAFVVVASLVASFIPARRASQVDPMAALRHE